MDNADTPAQEAGIQVVPEASEITYGEVEELSPDPAPEEPDSPPAAESDEAPEEPKEPEQKSKSQLRRERQKAAQKALEDQNEQLRREKEIASQAAQRMREAAEKLVEPQLAQFANPDDYTAALSAYRSVKLMDERQIQDHERRLQEIRQQEADQEAARQQHINTVLQDQFAEARERYADFDAVALNDGVRISPIGRDIIAASEVGADIAYYLGQNPELAAQISVMPPHMQAFELGRVESLAKATPQPKTVTTAPAPPTPVKAKGPAVKDPEKMSQAEYRAWREGGGTF